MTLYHNIKTRHTDRGLRWPPYSVQLKQQLPVSQAPTKGFLNGDGDYQSTSAGSTGNLHNIQTSAREGPEQLGHRRDPKSS